MRRHRRRHRRHPYLLTAPAAAIPRQRYGLAPPPFSSYPNLPLLRPVFRPPGDRC